LIEAYIERRNIYRRCQWSKDPCPYARVHFGMEREQSTSWCLLREICTFMQVARTGNSNVETTCGACGIVGHIPRLCFRSTLSMRSLWLRFQQLSYFGCFIPTVNCFYVLGALPQNKNKKSRARSRSCFYDVCVICCCFIS
jgi:hypothetical protein